MWSHYASHARLLSSDGDLGNNDTSVSRGRQTIKQKIFRFCKTSTSAIGDFAINNKQTSGDWSWQVTCLDYFCVDKIANTCY